MDKRKGYILTILGGAFWAVSGACGQYLFQNKGITSNWLVPVRLLSAGIIILSISIFQGKNKAFRVWRNKADVFQIIAFALFGTAMCQYAYFTSISESNAATATVLCYTSPAFIVLYMAYKNRKLPTRTEIMAILLVATGTFLCATHGNIHTLSISKEALFWGGLSAIAFCIYTVQPQQLLLKYDTLSVIGWGMLLGGVVLYTLFQPWKLQGTLDLTIISTMAVIIIFGTVLSFSFYLEGTKIIGEAKAGILSSVEPVVSTIISTVWLNVKFDSIDLIGFALIIFTAFLMVKDKV